MRLGLIGLGRIGAFHAETLTALDNVDGLVVTDALPEVTERIAGKFGAEPADDPADLLSRGVDGVIIAAATDAHPQLIMTGIFRDCSVHDFNIIRFVTGREVVEVYATGSTRGDRVFADSGDAATTSAISEVRR
jgi:predicted dehydrogenase